MKYIKTYEKVNDEIKIGDIVKFVKYNRQYLYKKEIYIGVVSNKNRDKTYNLKITKVMFYDFNNKLCAIDDGDYLASLSESESKKVKKLSEKELDKIYSEIKNFKIEKEAKKYNL